jgi:hypothetical protein
VSLIQEEVKKNKNKKPIKERKKEKAYQVWA